MKRTGIRSGFFATGSARMRPENWKNNRTGVKTNSPYEKATRTDTIGPGLSACSRAIRLTRAGNPEKRLSIDRNPTPRSDLRLSRISHQGRMARSRGAVEETDSGQRRAVADAGEDADQCHGLRQGRSRRSHDREGLL